jgi:hypothetical protein
MELLGLNEDEEEDSGSEQPDDDGLVAPKGLDEQADEASQARKVENNKENESD